MEKFVKSGNLEIWTESFGSPKNPPLILVMGVAGQGIMWTDDFCKSLAQDFFVIRYDHRDVGLSKHINYMIQPYSLKDLADDIIFIMNEYNLKNAHLLGSSMGGYLVQICMQRNPDRLKSATLLMSTVDFSPFGKAAAGTIAANDLPPPESKVLEGLKTIGVIDATNFDDWLFKSLKVLKLFNGESTEFNEAEWLPILEKSYLRRNKNVINPAVHNHVMACAQGPVNFYDIKASCPVHVIHGSADPMIPVVHAHKTAKHYNAKLSIIENMGHLRPKAFEDTLVKTITDFCISH
jgi:pimeloyl-ACP methyl ester carboxylesterase